MEYKNINKTDLIDSFVLKCSQIQTSSHLYLHSLHTVQGLISYSLLYCYLIMHYLTQIFTLVLFSPVSHHCCLQPEAGLQALGATQLLQLHMKGVRVNTFAASTTLEKKEVETAARNRSKQECNWRTNVVQEKHLILP